MSSDPTIQVVHDAVAFATAAVHGQPSQAQRIAHRALATDGIGFLDALITTVQAMADEADEAGADIGGLLCDLGIGIHLAAIDEVSPQ
jgi:hypothetical protein